MRPLRVGPLLIPCAGLIVQLATQVCVANLTAHLYVVRIVTIIVDIHDGVLVDLYRHFGFPIFVVQALSLLDPHCLHPFHHCADVSYMRVVLDGITRRRLVACRCRALSLPLPHGLLAVVRE